MSDPVPAITEAEATGEIAEIYADIRRVLGVEVVNLIWRHLAIHPGALPWAWGTLRPLYADGTITAEAAALHGDLDLPDLPPMPVEVLAAAGLTDADLAAIANVLAAYDRTNAMALVALSALLRGLSDAAGGAGGTSHGAAIPAAGADRAAGGAIPLPKLLTLDEMAPATARLVRALNGLGTRREDAILASMYRHLAHWPPYLALAWTILAPLDGDGRLDGAIADAVAKAGTRAAGIADRLPQHGTAPDAALAATIRTAIEPFVGDVIAKMVVICAILRNATRR
jgi:hypothetical protein